VTNLTVVVFPEGVDELQYTRAYNLRLLKCCARYAAKHPWITFVVKCKDPEHIEIFLADAELAKATTGLSNFVFPQRRRSDYADLMSSAMIVIAVGYTTPAVEALLLGKRVIYYSELNNHNGVFARIPGLIANSIAELDHLFAQALGDYDVYGKAVSHHVAELDPFCDGGVRERFGQLLTAGFTL
jgi:hypothetical protein